ncbi:MAG: fused MFS/spermidine synthase [Candidatus Thiodiazotropha sp.]
MTQHKMSNGTKLALYALTVFLASALLLVLEVVAGRLIAPYVGVSLYTWTAVIGVILAGLSVGNWLGGVWADRDAGETAAGYTLLVSALATLAIPLILTLVAPGIQTSTLSLLSSSLLLVLSLFFLPAMLLGVVTPILTTLALRLSSRTGHIVGMMHALAAVGSIFGTFVTGYWLIQQFGSRSVILAAALTLALLALPLLKQRKLLVYPVLAILSGLLLMFTYVRDGLSSPCDRESQYFCIRVVDEGWEMPPGRLKSMVLDHLLHGSNHSEDARVLAAPYVHLMDELTLNHFGKQSAQHFFFIGGGAYTLPRAVQALYPEARVTVAELDPAVTQMAVSQLYVETGAMAIQHADARLVLSRQSDARYDVIVADAFHDIAIPPHLVTLEMAQLVRQRLFDDGLYVLNIVDAFPDARLVKSMVKTLREVFPEVHVWLDQIPMQPTRATYVISASSRNGMPKKLHAQRGLLRRWLNVTEPVMATGTPADALPLLTDDHVPVERLMASLFLTRLGK